jgi:hypothetical protein
VHLFEDANLCAIHAKVRGGARPGAPQTGVLRGARLLRLRPFDANHAQRVTIMVKDMQLARRIRGVLRE